MQQSCYPNIRAGIVGTGFAGQLHARAARTAGAELVGIAASSSESAARALPHLGAKRAFADAYQLATSDDIDVVHICTPNHLHEPLALAALEAGKHVVCEKPLAMDRRSCERLANAAEAAGCIATVPFVYRFYPTVRQARTLAQTDDASAQPHNIGPIRLIQGSYQQDWLLAADDSNWRVDSELGGPSRAFADIGSHICDLIEFVSGHRIAAVCAHTITAIPERAPHRAQQAFAVKQNNHRQHNHSHGATYQAVDTEDAAILMFRTDRGASGTITVSQISPGRKNRLYFEITGANASLAFDQERPESLWLGQRAHATVLKRDGDYLAADGARLAYLPAGHPQGYQDCFALFVADTYAAISDMPTRAPAADRDSTPVALPPGLPQFADGVRAARIIEAVLQSAQAQTWVEV